MPRPQNKYFRNNWSTLATDPISISRTWYIYIYMMRLYDYLKLEMQLRIKTNSFSEVIPNSNVKYGSQKFTLLENIFFHGLRLTDLEVIWNCLYFNIVCHRNHSLHSLSAFGYSKDKRKVALPTQEYGHWTLDWPSSTSEILVQA